MDVQVTVCGWVGTAPEFHSGQGHDDRVVFRVGSTPRFFDRGQNGYRDRETVWFTVKAWRALAHHVASSVHKGDPVVVVGRLQVTVWQVDGEERRAMELEATSVGHDLAKGTSMFRRSAPSEQRPADRSTSQPTGPAVDLHRPTADDRQAGAA